MSSLWIVCLFTFIIHFIDTSAYAVKLVGVRTHKGAIAHSLFSVMAIFARTAQAIQAPLLAKSIEHQIQLGQAGNPNDFRIIICMATLAVFAGVFALPTMHRFLEFGINSLQRRRSMIKVMLRLPRVKTAKLLVKSFALPQITKIRLLGQYHDIPMRSLVWIVFTHAFVTTSVLSCMYAGYLQPDLRGTTMSMTGMSNALATVISLVVIAPTTAIIVDEVHNGVKTHAYFRKYLMFIFIGRVLGTLLAQLLFLPLSHLLVLIAQLLYV
jgi:hypothetical protein